MNIDMAGRSMDDAYNYVKGLKTLKKPYDEGIINEEHKIMMETLRRKTGIGLMACKKCLETYNWFFALALENYKQFEWDGKLYENE